MIVLLLLLGIPSRAEASSQPNLDKLGRNSKQGNLAPEPRATPGWIPLESESSIAQRQQPLKFPQLEILPDLRTLPPYGFLLETQPGTKQRLLRFSNSIWNSGEGALEVNGVQLEGRSRVRVQQHVYLADGSFQVREAGVFYYDSRHGHWHWENFSVYELWSVSTTGQLTELLIASNKIGYCLIDVSKAYLPHTPDGEPVLAVNPPAYRQYTHCEADLQGLSSGWTDTYRNHLPGQSLDITGLPVGLYALRSTVDPENRIREQNEGNNSTIIYFVLRADRLILLDEPVKAPPQRYAYA